MARAGLSRSDGSSVLDRYGSMETADLAVVFGSTNDYFWSDMPIASDTSEDDGYFSNAVRHLCLGMKEKYPGIPIVFIMPYQMRGIGNIYGGKDARTSSTHNTDQRNYVGCSLADYVRVQSQICRENQICVLDLFHNFKADIAHSDEDEARYTLDGCHPNANGHRMIADALYEFLNGMI